MNIRWGVVGCVFSFFRCWGGCGWGGCRFKILVLVVIFVVSLWYFIIIILIVVFVVGVESVFGLFIVMLSCDWV